MEHCPAVCSAPIEISACMYCLRDGIHTPGPGRLAMARIFDGHDDTAHRYGIGPTGLGFREIEEELLCRIII